MLENFSEVEGEGEGENGGEGEVMCFYWGFKLDWTGLGYTGRENQIIRSNFVKKRIEYCTKLRV